MNQSLQRLFDPPSFIVPTQRDYQSFVGAVIGYLQNQLAQYQIPYFQATRERGQYGYARIRRGLGINGYLEGYELGASHYRDQRHRDSHAA